MAYDALKNFAYSTVLTAPSPATSGASLVVQSGDGTKFPAASFNAVVWPAGAQPLTTNAEVVRVTVVSTDTFTITRAQEGSSARSIVVGDQISAAITAKTLTDMQIPGTNATSAYVATVETRATTSYGQLTTTTDAVTVTIGPSGLALVNISSYIQAGLGNGNYFVGIDVSGANTVAASDDRSLMYMGYANNTFGYFSGSFLYTGLSAGSTTFKMMYKASTGTGTYQNRRIGVVPF